MKIEIWKDIVGFEGLYQISNLGNVKSLNYLHTGKERILKLSKNQYGYLYVTFRKNGEKKNYLIHRLVCQSFIPNPNNLPQVNHKDECKTNNCVENLEWCTCKENINYGSHNKRVSEKMSKTVLQFTKDGEFIKEWKSGKDIQRILGFDSSHISRCCLGKRKSAFGFVWKYSK